MAAAKRLKPDSVFRHVSDRHAGLVRGWFGELRLGGLESGELVIHAASREQATYLERYCRPAFVEGAQAATGRLVSVRFAYRNGGGGPTDGLAESNAPPLRLSPAYTFDGFVVGPGNRMAHAAAVAVSAEPGRVYNPLFVYGGSGVGKTHLIQAICHRVLDQSPGLRAAYLSCEAFASDYIEAVATDAVPRFQERYRLVDLLVVDDVQLLASRERSQEEFFHTFNALHQEQRQIVLAADRHPEAMEGLQERLASRFKWGLVVEIDPACLETRAAVVRKKAGQRGIEMPDNVVMQIASEVPGSVRELEGALAKIQNHAQGCGHPITVELARAALGTAASGPERVVRLEAIVRAVALRYGVRRKDLRGPGRSQS